MKGSQRQYRVPAAESLLSILTVLAEDQAEQSLASLTKRLPISKNMAFRIVHLLEHRGFLERGSQVGSYRAGPGFFRLAAHLDGRQSLVERARPHLQWLSRETDDTASLQCPDGDRVVVKAVELPASAYAFHLAVGARLLYVCNAMGKCILAHLDPARIRGLLPEGEAVPLPRGSRPRAELMAELELVRQTDLGHDREEYLAGVVCIATPVRDACGQVIGGVGITSLCARPESLPDHEKARLVIETGRRISASLGFIPPTTPGIAPCTP